MKVPLQDGDWVDVPLDDHWVEQEGPNVQVVKVRRFQGRGETVLGRIDTAERVYHVRHHGLADFVRWSDRTATLGLEELRLAGKAGVTEVRYLDESNGRRYSISMETLRTEGWAVRREKIGWRWATVLDDWDVS